MNVYTLLQEYKEKFSMIYTGYKHYLKWSVHEEEIKRQRGARKKNLQQSKFMNT